MTDPRPINELIEEELAIFEQLLSALNWWHSVAMHAHPDFGILYGVRRMNDKFITMLEQQGIAWRSPYHARNNQPTSTTQPPEHSGPDASPGQLD